VKSKEVEAVAQSEPNSTENNLGAKRKRSPQLQNKTWSTEIIYTTCISHKNIVVKTNLDMVIRVFQKYHF
jgi:hypothetical protein